MIKAVIFDVGGVLVRTMDRSGRHRWEVALGLNNGEAEELVFNSKMGWRAQRGEITDADLWNWIGERLELSSAGLAAFQEDFWSGDVLDEELATLIRGLRTKYQTAIISNATDALRGRLVTRYPIADAFDLIICSAEERIMKPDATIYMRALGRLGVSADETIFVDDFWENIEAARNVGIETIHYAPGVDVAARLLEHGVER